MGGRSAHPVRMCLLNIDYNTRIHNLPHIAYIPEVRGSMIRLAVWHGTCTCTLPLG